MSCFEEPVIVTDSDSSGAWGPGRPELLVLHLGGSQCPLSSEGLIPAAQRHTCWSPQHHVLWTTSVKSLNFSSPQGSQLEKDVCHHFSSAVVGPLGMLDLPDTELLSPSCSSDGFKLNKSQMSSLVKPKTV